MGAKQRTLQRILNFEVNESCKNYCQKYNIPLQIQGGIVEFKKNEV